MIDPRSKCKNSTRVVTRDNFDAQTIKRINDTLIDLFSLYVLNSQYKTTRWYSADHFRLKLNQLHVHMYAHNYKTPARAYVCTKSQNFMYCTCLCRRKNYDLISCTCVCTCKIWSYIRCSYVKVMHLKCGVKRSLKRVVLAISFKRRLCWSDNINSYS